MFDFASELVRQGKTDLAEQVLRELTQDKNAEYRAEARFRLARLAEMRGDIAGAEAWLRSVLEEKPDAAGVRLELARLLAARKDERGAARQLQRAQAAGLPEEVARAVDRIIPALRNTAPWGGSLELGIAPDSNINRGTSDDAVDTIVGPLPLDQDARARSGIGGTFAGDVFVRAMVGKDVTLGARVSTLGSVYRDSAFNDISGQISAGPEARLGRTRVRVAATLGRRWFGDALLYRQWGAAIDARRPVGRTSALSVAVNLSETDHRIPDQSGTWINGRISLEKALTPRLFVRIDANAARTGARAEAFAAKSFGGGGLISREAGGTILYAGAEYARTVADGPFLLFGRKRDDDFVDATIGVQFRKVRIERLSPLIRFRHSRNRSPLNIYDFTRSRIELSLSTEL